MMNIDEIKGKNIFLKVDDHEPAKLQVDDYGIHVILNESKFYIAERLQFPSGIYEGIKILRGEQQGVATGF
jgi:hypothetical protein